MSLSINQNQQYDKNYRYGYNMKFVSDIQKNPNDIVDSSNNIITNAYEYKDDPKLITAVTIPVWAILANSMQIFNKNCATKIKDGKQTSVLHKVQNFSDKLGKKFDASKTGKFVNNIYSKLSLFLQNKVVKKTKVMNSVINNPAEPQLTIAKIFSKGTIAETAQDAIEAIERYCASQGKTIEELGLIKNVEFEKIAKNPYQNLENIKSMLKQIPEQPIEVCRSKTPIIKQVLSRKVYPSELLNKINTLSGKSLINEEIKLSSLGKSMPKVFLRTMEGLTNGTAGGKVAILMQAYAIADAIVRAVQAPKNEKIKTFTESITYDLSFYLMAPLGMGLMYHAAGAKYAGMTSEEVEKYRAGVKALNDKVAAGKCTKAEYKTMKTALKKQLNGKSNIFVKLFKSAGKFLAMGLEKIAPYTNEKTSAFEKSLKNIPNKLKGITGGIMRFFLYMFVIAPPLVKAVTKVSHLIFGKPTCSIIDEEKNKNDVTPEQIIQTITVQKPNRQFEKNIYSDNQNYLQMYNESVFLEKERKSLLSENTIKIQKEENVENQISPKYFEEGQNGYIPSTKGYVEEVEKTSYIPSTKSAPAIEQDLTDAKKAIKNSFLVENFVNKKMKGGINPHLGNKSLLN